MMIHTSVFVQIDEEIDAAIYSKITDSTYRPVSLDVTYQVRYKVTPLADGFRLMVLYDFPIRTLIESQLQGLDAAP